MPRGGARPGAGRKAGPERATKGVSLTLEAWVNLAHLASRMGCTQTDILEGLIKGATSGALNA